MTLGRKCCSEGFRQTSSWIRGKVYCFNGELMPEDMNIVKRGFLISVNEANFEVLEVFLIKISRLVVMRPQEQSSPLHILSDVSGKFCQPRYHNNAINHFSSHHLPAFPIHFQFASPLLLPFSCFLLTSGTTSSLHKLIDGFKSNNSLISEKEHDLEAVFSIKFLTFRRTSTWVIYGKIHFALQPPPKCQVEHFSIVIKLPLI